MILTKITKNEKETIDTLMKIQKFYKIDIKNEDCFLLEYLFKSKDNELIIEYANAKDTFDLSPFTKKCFVNTHIKLSKDIVYSIDYYTRGCEDIINESVLEYTNPGVVEFKSGKQTYKICKTDIGDYIYFKPCKYKINEDETIIGINHIANLNLLVKNSNGLVSFKSFDDYPDLDKYKILTENFTYTEVRKFSVENIILKYSIISGIVFGLIGSAFLFFLSSILK